EAGGSARRLSLPGLDPGQRGPHPRVHRYGRRDGQRDQDRRPGRARQLRRLRGVDHGHSEEIHGPVGHQQGPQKKLTRAELFPYMLCLRYAPRWMHPDEMLVEMPAGWLEDWARVHRQINLGIDRDDLLWGLQRAEFLNANMGEDGSPITDPREVMPYVTEDEW